MLIAERIVTHDLAALRLMFLQLIQSYYLWTEAALNSEAVNNLLDHPARPSDFNVLVAHRAILVENQPVFDTKLAKQFVAVVALFGVTAHLCKLSVKHLLKQI